MAVMFDQEMHMKTNVYRFTFAPDIDPTEAEATLHLALLACEGLYGESRVRMDASYHADPPRSVIVVDGSTPAGSAIVRIFTAFLNREFGPDDFTVRRVAAAASTRTSLTAMGAAA